VRPSRTAGQAAAEYVAVLLVIALVLAGAAALAVAVPGVGERLVATVRTGLCIVGGDVCRGTDAAAAGLAPCITSERSRRQDTTLDLAVVRVGGHGEWQVALRSDGQAVVTRLEDNELGGTIGVGLAFSPAHVDAQARAALVARYHGGRAWRFPDARAAGAFLARAMHDASVHERRPPDVSWHAIGGDADGVAGVAIANLAQAGLTASADSAIGLRNDGARRTLTLELGFDDPRLFTDLPGFPSRPGTQRAWVADVSWERGTARELALRTAVTGGDRVEEYSARLDLRDAGNRAVAERLLHPGGSTPGDVRALIARVKSDGVVERDAYAYGERRRGFSVAGRLGIALGLAHQRISSERRLIDAIAWIDGDRPQRRFDCLGV
jgi:hypothetical protein